MWLDMGSLTFYWEWTLNLYLMRTCWWNTFIYFVVTLCIDWNILYNIWGKGTVTCLPERKKRTGGGKAKKQLKRKSQGEPKLSKRYDRAKVKACTKALRMKRLLCLLMCVIVNPNWFSQDRLIRIQKQVVKWNDIYSAQEVNRHTNTPCLDFAFCCRSLWTTGSDVDALYLDFVKF